jgi:hypothetical protein
VSEEPSRAIIEQALRNRELLDAVPAVVALSFGVLPVKKQGSVLTVACFPHANREALRLLREVLLHEIVAFPVEERPLQTALQKAYQTDDDRSPNFPTFREPDFLGRPGAAQALRCEKVEPIGATGSSLAEGAIVLAAWSYRSCLWNLDHPGTGGALPEPRTTKYELRDQELAWAVDKSGSPFRVGAKLAPDAVLLANEWRLSDHRHVAPGALFAEHRVLGTALGPGELPYVIHPTEVQLARVEPSGALVFHVYDHEVRVLPEEPTTFHCSYHFLSFGNRLRREIEVEVHELSVADRAQLPLREGSPGWTPRELERWFAAPPARPSAP